MWIRRSSEGDIGFDVEVDVDIDSYFGCSEGLQRQFRYPYGIEEVTVLTLRILIFRALEWTGLQVQGSSYARPELL